MAENVTVETLLTPHLFSPPTNLSAVSLAQETNTNTVVLATDSSSISLGLQLPAAVSLYQLDLEARPRPVSLPRHRHHRPLAQPGTSTMAAKPRALVFALSVQLHLRLT